MLQTDLCICPVALHSLLFLFRKNRLKENNFEMGVGGAEANAKR